MRLFHCITSDRVQFRPSARCALLLRRRLFQARLLTAALPYLFRKRSRRRPFHCDLEFRDALRRHHSGNGNQVDHHLVQQRIVAGMVAAGDSVVDHALRIVPRQFRPDLPRSIPELLPDRFQHPRGNRLFCPGVKNLRSPSR